MPSKNIVDRFKDKVISHPKISAAAGAGTGLLGIGGLGYARYGGRKEDKKDDEKQNKLFNKFVKMSSSEKGKIALALAALAVLGYNTPGSNESPSTEGSPVDGVSSSEEGSSEESEEETP